MSTIIRITWRTEVMKASAFTYYHQSCYQGQQFTNGVVTELDASEVSPNRECDGCNEKLCETREHAA